MIEIYLLEHLQAFHDCGTLSAAADQLNISQPSLSRSMQKLESLLGVTLFERQKNKISLNETGRLAAAYAKRILEQESEMEQHVRAFAKSQHTLSIGSCAPGPLMVLLPQTANLFSDMTVTSSMDTEDNLIKGLGSDAYTLIILAGPLDDPAVYCRPYCREQLCLSVTPFHPAASCQKVSFADMDGQSFIMYAHVGIWEKIVRKKMPHAKFFKQEDLDAVGELARYSDLPSFSTDITLNIVSSRQNDRFNIPFSDPESLASFWLACRTTDARTRKFMDGLQV